MKTENVIKLGVDAALKGAQFQRKSNTWYRDLEETILVVDVQKSNFGEQYYINLGVFVKNLPANRGGGVPPRENECHIRLRIEALMPNEAEQLKQILNLADEAIGTTERKQQIEKTIAQAALPFLLQCSTRAGIRDAHRHGHFDHALIQKSIRETVLS